VVGEGSKLPDSWPLMCLPQTGLRCRGVVDSGIRLCLYLGPGDAAAAGDDLKAAHRKRL
jgi:hypothetical protein